MPVQFCGNKPPYTPQPLCPCPSVRGWPIRTDLLDRLDAWMQSAVFIRRYRCHHLAQTAPQAAIECPVSWRLWTWLRALSFSQPQLAFIMKGCYGAAFNRFFVLCVCVCIGVLNERMIHCHLHCSLFVTPKISSLAASMIYDKDYVCCCEEPRIHLTLIRICGCVRWTGRVDFCVGVQ